LVHLARNEDQQEKIESRSRPSGHDKESKAA